MSLKILLILLTAQSAFAETTISTIENRKTGAKIVVQKITDNTVDVVHMTGLGSKKLTTLDIQNAVDGKYEMTTPSGLKLHLYHKMMDTTSSIGRGMETAIVDFTNWCVEDVTIGATIQFFLICFVPIPGAAVYYPAVAGSMTAALVATFIAGHVILPIEATINGVGLLFSNPQKKANRSWNQAIAGKSSKVSDKVFRKLLVSIEALK